MNTPYIWSIPENYPDKLLGSYVHETSPNYLLFSEGKAFESGSQRISIQFNAKASKLKEFDVLPNDMLLPLVSKRVMKMLSLLGSSEVQFLSTCVKASDGSVSDYWLLNALIMVSGICHQESDYAMITGTSAIRSFRRLAYRSDALQNHHIAREKEYEPFLLVSETVKELFEKNKIKAVDFVKPSDAVP